MDLSVKYSTNSGCLPTLVSIHLSSQIEFQHVTCIIRAKIVVYKIHVHTSIIFVEHISDANDNIALSGLKAEGIGKVTISWCKLPNNVENVAMVSI